jgi:Tfp pilus assembly protein PilX
MQSTNEPHRAGNSMTILSSEKGFVLIVAVLATIVFLALGFMALNMSGRDIGISSRVVGEKKAFSACQSGIHRMVITFDPENLTSSAVTDVQVDATNDPASLYSIGTPSRPTSGPGMLPLAGYAIGGGQVWGQTRYTVTVTGRNTNYGTRMSVSGGVGYGPIEITTISR